VHVSTDFVAVLSCSAFKGLLGCAEKHARKGERVEAGAKTMKTLTVNTYCVNLYQSFPVVNL
jgi:hypothetical protein